MVIEEIYGVIIILQRIVICVHQGGGTVWIARDITQQNCIWQGYITLGEFFQLLVSVEQDCIFLGQGNETSNGVINRDSWRNS